ncbi:MAG: prepilin-type N-terminal cleavage/methylation domain-containing protein [Pseudomonadota bacterium]
MTAGRPARGFTLIELLVVLAVMAMLVSLVAPRYLERVDAAREAVLRHNLQGLRTAIDQFYRDKARYPASLDELAAQRYVRVVPIDPLTGSAHTWIAVPPTAGAGVFDIKSGATGRAGDGSDYASW